MKIITLHQPYATGVIRGFKTIIMRDQNTDHRGVIGIHASKKIPEYNIMKKSSGIPWDTSLTKTWVLPTKTDFPYGGIIGTVELENVVDTESDELPIMSKYDLSLLNVGRYAYIVTNPQAMKLVESNGKRGIWNMEISEQAKEAVP